MDKLKKLVRFDGIRGLPPGFRFEPTEEELVFEYLKCKVLSSSSSSSNLNLCASIIPEILDVCNYDPWDLPGGNGEEEMRYLFSKNRNGKRSKRRCTTPSGYWKAMGSEMEIVASSASNWNNNNNNNNNWSSGVGIKKTLVFFATPGPNNANTKAKARRTKMKTRWVMHEYSLLLPPQAQMDKENWVVCRIFCNKPNMNINMSHTNANYDFMMMDQNENHYGRSSCSSSVSSTASSSSSS